MGSYPIFSSNINDTQLPCVFEEKKAGTNFLNTNGFVVQTDAKFSFFHFKVRNSAVRTLFQTLSTHGQKLSKSMWEDCLWLYVFPMLEHVSHLVSNVAIRKGILSSP